MSVASPTALDLVHRYGGKEIADVAVPAELLALSPAQMEAAAAGEDLSGCVVDPGARVDQNHIWS